MEIPQNGIPHGAVVKEIPLANGRGIVLVDDEDYDALSQFSWSTDEWGYARRSISTQSTKSGRSGVSMHRQILGLEHGDNFSIDHKDRNPLNNQKSNLRIVTSAQNAMNRSLSTANTSGLRGVCWVKSRGKWNASIQSNRKRINLGYFDKQEDAYTVYCEAAKNLHGEYSSVDFDSAPPIRDELLRHLTKRKNRSGFKGVNFNRETRKWFAKITIDGKSRYLGSFETPELAHEAYSKAKAAA